MHDKEKWPKDIHGTPLKNGDIVAEGTIGKIIWDGKAKVIARPIGVFRINDNPKIYQEYPPEPSDFRNIHQIREGKVEFINSDEYDTITDDKKQISLHLSCYDGNFFGWDSIEIIGNIFEDFN